MQVSILGFGAGIHSSHLYYSWCGRSEGGATGVANAPPMGHGGSQSKFELLKGICLAVIGIPTMVVKAQY